jgi:hypothetical protein
MRCRIIPGRYVFSGMNAIQVLNVRGGEKRVHMEKISEDNRRKEKRTQVDDNVYVVVDTQPEMMGQMVEISSTGMAFTFVDLDAVSDRLSGRRDLHVDLFAAGKGYFIRSRFRPLDYLVMRFSLLQARSVRERSSMNLRLVE